MSEVVTFGPFKKRQRRVHWCVVHDQEADPDYNPDDPAACCRDWWMSARRDDLCDLRLVALVPVGYQRLPEGWSGDD